MIDLSSSSPHSNIKNFRNDGDVNIDSSSSPRSSSSPPSPSTSDALSPQPLLDLSYSPSPPEDLVEFHQKNKSDVNIKNESQKQQQHQINIRQQAMTTLTNCETAHSKSTRKLLHSSSSSSLNEEENNGILKNQVKQLIVSSSTIVRKINGGSSDSSPSHSFSSHPVTAAAEKTKNDAVHIVPSLNNVINTTNNDASTALNSDFAATSTHEKKSNDCTNNTNNTSITSANDIHSQDINDKKNDVMVLNIDHNAANNTTPRSNSTKFGDESNNQQHQYSGSGDTKAIITTTTPLKQSKKEGKSPTAVIATVQGATEEVEIDAYFLAREREKDRKRLLQRHVSSNGSRNGSSIASFRSLGTPRIHNRKKIGNDNNGNKVIDHIARRNSLDFRKEHDFSLKVSDTDVYDDESEDELLAFHQEQLEKSQKQVQKLQQQEMSKDDIMHIQRKNGNNHYAVDVINSFSGAVQQQHDQTQDPNLTPHPQHQHQILPSKRLQIKHEKSHSSSASFSQHEADDIINRYMFPSGSTKTYYHEYPIDDNNDNTNDNINGILPITAVANSSSRGGSLAATIIPPSIYNLMKNTFLAPKNTVSVSTQQQQGWNQYENVGNEENDKENDEDVISLGEGQSSNEKENNYTDDKFDEHEQLYHISLHDHVGNSTTNNKVEKVRRLDDFSLDMSYTVSHHQTSSNLDDSNDSDSGDGYDNDDSNKQNKLFYQEIDDSDEDFQILQQFYCPLSYDLALKERNESLKRKLKMKQLRSRNTLVKGFGCLMVCAVFLVLVMNTAIRDSFKKRADDAHGMSLPTHGLIVDTDEGGSSSGSSSNANGGGIREKFDGSNQSDHHAVKDEYYETFVISLLLPLSSPTAMAALSNGTIFYSSNGNANNDRTAEQMAFHWLLYTDTQKIPQRLYQVSNTGLLENSNSYETEVQVLTFRLRQRLALATLWFATTSTSVINHAGNAGSSTTVSNDNDSISGRKGSWYMDTNWMGGVNECEWFGVTCVYDVNTFYPPTTSNSNKDEGFTYNMPSTATSMATTESKTIPSPGLSFNNDDIFHNDEEIVGISSSSMYNIHQSSSSIPHPPPHHRQLLTHSPLNRLQLQEQRSVVGIVTKLNLPRNNLYGTLPKDHYFYDSNNLNKSENYDLNSNYYEVENNENKGNKKNSISSAIVCLLSKFYLPHLKELDVSNNELRGELPTALFQSTNLETLDIGFNKLEGDLQRYFDKALFAPGTTSITANAPSDDMPEMVLQHKLFLKYVRMNNNQFESSKGQPLQFLQTLGLVAPNLATLLLEHNQLKGILPTSTPTSTETVFAMSDETLLPPSLQILRLSHNMLSGTIPNNFFGGGTKILTENAEHGITTTKHVIYKKNDTMESKLLQLHLDHNQFEGTLPSYSIWPKDMEDLRLDHNLFSGSLLPDTFIDMGMLAKLRLNDNRFTGTIPHWINQLISLEEFQIQDNNLNGTVPPELGDLKEISEISLYGNSLSGGIPKKVCQLPKLIILTADCEEPAHLVCDCCTSCPVGD